MNSFYGALSIALAIICAVGGAVLVVVASLRQPTVFWRTYWKLLAITGAICGLGFILYKSEHFASVLGKLVIAMGMFSGVVVGGIVAALVYLRRGAAARVKERTRAG